MAVVIRLQGLRITAGSEDIRKFFTGLKIPDGGVHIIGGEREEAFIIFASDEDARRAMTRSGGLIRGSPVLLLLSSKTEMQNVLERSTQMLEMDHQRQPDESRRPNSNLAYTPSPQNHMAPNNDDFLCLFLKGLPFTVTEKEILDFFGGLNVDDVVLLKHRNGANNGKGLVKFATREDALEGLKRDKEYIGSRYIEISSTTMDDWFQSTGRQASMRTMNQEFDRGRSLDFNQRSPKERVRSRSPVGQRDSAHSDEYCVQVDNLSFTVEKEHIKQLFHTANLEDDQILHLNDNSGRRTRAAFVLFKNRRDYCDALALENTHFLNRALSVRPISRENMLSLLERQCMAFRPPGNSERTQERPPSHRGAPFSSDNFCVFARNLPFDVRKVEIMDFFHGYSITEDKVCVLHDHTGAGVGKALVLFGSEAEAKRALSLNGQRFLGSEVILKIISPSQMQQLLAEPPAGPGLPPQDQGFPSRSSDPFFRHQDTGYLNEGIPPDDNVPMRNVQGQGHGGLDFKPGGFRSGSSSNGGNRFCHGFDSPVQQVDMPTCVQLLNLPFQIKPHEIYDFCYGFKIVPGSVSLQYDPMGRPTGYATLLFQSRQEALTAIKELSGRPIGPRKIHLMLE